MREAMHCFAVASRLCRAAFFDVEPFTLINAVNVNKKICTHNGLYGGTLANVLAFYNSLFDIKWRKIPQL